MKNLIASVELIRVHMIASNHKVELARWIPSEEPDITLDAPRFKGLQSAEQPFFLHCGAKFRLGIHQGDDSPFVTISAEYKLLYRLADEAKYTPEEIQEFAGNNGIFNAWPFFREFAHATSCRIGLEPIVLPVLRLPPNYQAAGPSPKPRKTLKKKR